MFRRPKTVTLIAGLASATGFAPLGLWPVALLALAVLSHAVAAAPNWRAAFARGWLFGVGQFVLGLNWIAHAFAFQDAMPHWLGYGAVVALSLYLAVYPALAALLAWGIVSFAQRREPQAAAAAARPPAPAGEDATFVLAFAAAWIATEYLRATLFSGFAWNPLGVVWVGTPVARAAVLVGTYGLSGLTIVIGGALFMLWHRRWSQAFVVCTPVAAVLIGGVVVNGADPAQGSAPLIRIVQHNTSQAERHDADHDEASVRALERLSGRPGAAPRLIVWPEGAVPYFLEEEQFARERLTRLLGPRDLLLAGGDALIYDTRGTLVAARNSVFALAPDARIVARYDKAHLVPYGEYLPMRPLLSALGLSRLVPGDLDFVPGRGPRSIALPGFGPNGILVGVQICYEITFSGHVVDRGDRPSFIFNPSTDAWFGAWGPPQHLAQARLRAIEEGLPVVRATPTGISAMADADGRVLAAVPLDKAGFIQMRLPGAHLPTPFARYGNILPAILALALAILAVARAPRRR